jgi:hypothetical protein
LQKHIKLTVGATETKRCTTCKQDRPISYFRSRGGQLSHLLKSRCNRCLYKAHAQWISNNPERVREYRKKDKWTLIKRCNRRGITPQILIEQYEQQNCQCPICKNNIELLDSAIDHNHQTGKFRGVLCKTCNRAIGMLKDSTTILSNAILYLDKEGNYSKN